MLGAQLFGEEHQVAAQLRELPRVLGFVGHVDVAA